MSVGEGGRERTHVCWQMVREAPLCGFLKMQVKIDEREGTSDRKEGEANLWLALANNHGFSQVWKELCLTCAG